MPAAAESVAAGADRTEPQKRARHLELVPDPTHALRRLRTAQGLTQREVGDRAGCNSRTVAAIESGKRIPSVELAGRLAETVGGSLADVFGDPGLCECECGEPTFSRFLKGHFQPGGVASRRRSAELEAYKREKGLLGAPELAAATGLKRHSLTRLVRRGRLPAHRYPGDWQEASRPWLFTRDAIEIVRRLQTVDRRESYRQRARAFHAARRALGVFGTKPRRGEERECLDGCGRVVYLHPSELAKRPGYATVSCACRERWRTGRLADEEHDRDRLIEHYSGEKRRFWRRRWRAPIVGRLGGRKVRYTDAAARVVHDLKRKHPDWGRATVACEAKRLGEHVTEKQVRRILHRPRP